jgi:dCTP deaminase
MDNPQRFGALPYQNIKAFIADGAFKNAKEENVNPASLDFSLSEEIYRVEGIFLPRPGEKVAELLEKAEHLRHAFENPLERDVTYLARLNEIVALPPDIYGYCNPKSSTGRNDVHVRVLADGVSRYDTIPRGYRGTLWLAVNPRSYPVKVSPGERLTQGRFFNRDTRLSEQELKEVMSKESLVFDSHGEPIRYEDIQIKDGDGSVILRLDLDQDVVGFECLGSNKVMDFSKRKFYHPDDFFREVKKEEESVSLKKGGFYILSTKEAVRVPPSMALEVAPMDERSGEFRSHYAGFFDPGWGYGKNGEGKGRPATLEVRPFEDMIIRNKQAIAKVKFEHLTEIPEVIYDSIGTSNYTAQSNAKLSKHFKEIQ